MKQKLLIVEPSEVIVAGLKAILEGQIRFKLLEPEVGTDQLEERIIAMRPDILLVNPTLIKNPAEVRADFPMAVVAFIIETLAQISPEKQEHSQNSYELTKRETAVLVQLAQGKTNKEIADALNVSVHTVISHRKNITHKTGIKSVAGLTVFAMLNNLIDESTLL